MPENIPPTSALLWFWTRQGNMHEHTVDKNIKNVIEGRKTFICLLLNKWPMWEQVFVDFCPSGFLGTLLKSVYSALKKYVTT